MTEKQKKMVVEHLGLVRYIIKKQQLLKYGEYEDVFQAGCLGLIRAVLTYDETQSSLISYASKLIRCDIIDMFRNQHRTYSLKEPPSFISIEKSVNDYEDSNNNILDRYHSKLNHEDFEKTILDRWDIEQLISYLTCNLTCKQRDKEIFILYINGLTMSEIAKRYKLSQARISCIIKDCRMIIKNEWSEAEKMNNK